MGRSRSTTRAARALAVAATILALAGSGCVERRMIIRTNPPGALAYVDDNEVGLTPVAISPIYYGNRKIRLVKDGCETQEFIQSVPPPWYEIPPLDFFSENSGPRQDPRRADLRLSTAAARRGPERRTARPGREPASRHADVDGRRYARLSGQPAVAGTGL